MIPLLSFRFVISVFLLSGKMKGCCFVTSTAAFNFYHPLLHVPYSTYSHHVNPLHTPFISAIFSGREKSVDAPSVSVYLPASQYLI